MINQLTYMGMIDEHVDTKSLKYDLTDMMYKYYGTELNEVHGGMNDLIHIMRKYMCPCQGNLYSLLGELVW